MLPRLINITNGKLNDLSASKKMELENMLEKGSILVFDRGYIDYDWWNKLDGKGITFVSRTKKKPKHFRC